MGENVEVSGVDNDSSFLIIKTEDFFEDIKPDIKEWWDTSNFSENNKFGLPRLNAKKLGKFKIEIENKGVYAENIVTKQVGIRA
jgi:hypothetical protein